MANVTLTMNYFNKSFRMYNGIFTSFLKNFTKACNLSTNASTAMEQTVRVENIDINYAKTGSGKHPVLLLPGALGTIWTDFKPQLEGLDKERLTVIAWDPPGYGESRPPARTFPANFFERDAEWAQKLMLKLGHEKFSLVGWSDGGITSLILAARYPENVRKMIVFGANAYIKPEEMDIYEKIRNIDSWSERMRAPLIEIYGEEYFRRTWSDWVDGMRGIFQSRNGDICKGEVKKINCPTLIIHGEKDPMVLREHPEFLKSHIPNSRVEYFEKGAHNLHLRFAKEFNEMVNKFLLE
ncbi:hypothetical protein TKK_0008410 [Trichogramma kaykai]|uniref:AB hydrolase-1 domain-containing protein n=1 Tax=Trichogramma kaykai TaxID=54128 RepID=A0ABD2X5J4_9HYME